jgi:hypothetical protein
MKIQLTTSGVQNEFLNTVLLTHEEVFTVVNHSEYYLLVYDALQFSINYSPPNQ